MKTDDQNHREDSREESFSNSEQTKPTTPFWKRYSLVPITALIALWLVVFAASYTFIPQEISLLYPGAKTDGTWQGQFTYDSSKFQMPPFQAILHIEPHQEEAFEGTLSEPEYGNTIVSVSGIAGKSSRFNQSQLHYVTQLYGSGTGTFITFTDLAYIQGNEITLHCSYIAVVYSDGSLHGVWSYPGDRQPDGTLILHKTR